MIINPTLFKKTLVLFWTLWWLITLWTDVVGGIAHLGLLKETWTPDTNYPFLASSLAIYHVPNGLITALFIAILIGSFISALSFLWASLSLTKNISIWVPRAEAAFIISLTFWLAFFIADQLVFKFDLEENHMVQGGFQLLSFFCLYLLPCEKNNRDI